MATGGAGGDNAPMFDDPDDHSLDLTDDELLWDKKLKEAIDNTLKQDVNSEKEASKGDELDRVLKQAFKKEQGDGESSKAMTNDRHRKVIKEMFDTAMARVNSDEAVKGEVDVAEVTQDWLVKDISGNINKTEQAASEDQKGTCDVNTTSTKGSSPLADYSDSDIEIIEVAPSSVVSSTAAPASSPLPYSTGDSDDELNKALPSELLQKVMEIFPHIDMPYLERTYWRLQRTNSKKEDLFEELVRYLLERRYPREDDPQPCSVTVCDGQITEVEVMKKEVVDTNEGTQELCPYEEMEDSGVVEFGGDNGMDQSDGSLKMKGSGDKATRYSPYKLHGATVAGRGKHNISGKTRIKSSVNKYAEAVKDFCRDIYGDVYNRMTVGSSYNSITSLTTAKPSDIGLHVTLPDPGCRTTIPSVSQQSSTSGPVMLSQQSSATNTTASLSTVTSERIHSLTHHRSVWDAEPSPTSLDTKISQAVQTYPLAVNTKPVPDVCRDTIISIPKMPKVSVIDQTKLSHEQKMRSPRLNFPPLPPERRIPTPPISTRHRSPLVPTRAKRSSETPPPLGAKCKRLSPPIPCRIPSSTISPCRVPSSTVSTPPAFSMSTMASGDWGIVPDSGDNIPYTYWETDEGLGVDATISSILYCNMQHPELKQKYPEWAMRLKQICKIWRKLTREQKAPYMLKATKNRAVKSQGKTKTPDRWTTQMPVHTPATPNSPEKSDKPMMLCEGCDACYGHNKMVQCCDGHVLCTQCVEKAAKAVLVGDKKGFVACCLESCNSSVPKSVLVQKKRSSLARAFEADIEWMLQLTCNKSKFKKLFVIENLNENEFSLPEEIQNSDEKDDQNRNEEDQNMDEEVDQNRNEEDQNMDEDVEQNMDEDVEQNMDEDVEQNMDEKVDQNSDEDVEQNMDEKVDQNSDEEVDQNSDEVDQNSDEEVDKNSDEEVDQNSDEEVDQYSDEEVDQNSDEEVDQNSDEEVDKNSDEEVDHNSDEEVDQYSDEEVDQNSDEEVDQNSDEEVDKNSDEEVDQNSDEEVDQYSDEEVDQNSDEEVDQNSDEEVDQNSDEEVDQNSDKEVDKNSDEEVDQNSDEEVYKNTDEEVEQNRSEISDIDDDYNDPDYKPQSESEDDYIENASDSLKNPSSGETHATLEVVPDSDEEEDQTESENDTLFSFVRFIRKEMTDTTESKPHQRKLNECDKICDSKYSNIYIKKYHKSFDGKRGNERKDSRPYDTVHSCVFCKKLFTHIQHHLETMHGDEEMVTEIKKLKKKMTASGNKSQFKSQIKKLQDCLRFEGDHCHNLNVKECKEGELLIQRKSCHEEHFNVEEYGPCPECLQWIKLGSSVKIHQKNCPKSVKETSFAKKELIWQARHLIGEEHSSDRLRKEVFSKMNNDDIGTCAQSDDLICKLGEVWLSKSYNHPLRRGKDSSFHMRLAARLLTECRKRLNRPALDMIELLTIENFDTIVDATLWLCGRNEHDELKHPSTANKIGFDLARMVALKYGICLKAKDQDGIEDSDGFLKYMKIHWSTKVSTQSNHLLATRHFENRRKLPHPKDIEVVSTKLTEKLSSIDYRDTTQYAEVARIALIRLMVYNRRRSGEIEELKMTTYLKRRREVDDVEESLLGEMTTTEKYLIKSQELMWIRGKRGRRVPVLIPIDASEALAYITNEDVRKKGGVQVSNRYMFASRGDGVIRASECIKNFGYENASELIHPDRLTSTGYRAYMATIAQCLGLKDHQIQWLCTHMGHTLDVHQSHYRFALDGIERTQLGKLLLLQDKNLLSKYKDKELKDIEFEDIISSAEGLDTGPSEVGAAPSGFLDENEVELELHDMGELRKALPSIVLDLLEEQWKKETLDALENMTDIVKCPGCSFSAALDVAVKCFQCANCNQSYCRYCEVLWPWKNHELCIKMTSRSSVVSGSNILIPAHWSEPINKEGYSEVDLSKDSTEYKEIKKQFYDSIHCARTKVKRVFRVQNQRLWEKYNLARGHMVDDLGESLINEKRVYHGTSIETIDAICKEGFDWRLSGKHATAFGQGTYFAKHASYSDKYASGKVKVSTKFGGRSATTAPFGVFMPTTSSTFTFGAQTTNSTLPPPPFPSGAPTTMTTGPFNFGAPSTAPGTTVVSGWGFGGPQMLASGGAQSNTGGISFGAPAFGFGTPPLTASGFGTSTAFLPNPASVPNMSVFGPSSSQPNPADGSNSKKEHTLCPSHKYLFVARILAGRTCQGNSSMRRPDVDQNSGKLCHSAVDHVHSPKIFVIFESSQCYPEYLIEYS